VTYIPATVPAKNSTANTTIIEAVGNKTDDETNVITQAGAQASLLGYAYVHEKHFHSAQEVWPADLAGITLTAGIANTLGDAVAIINVNDISAPYDIHHILIHNFSKNETWCLVLYAGTPLALGAELGRIRVVKTATADPTLPIMIMTPMQAGNAALCAKVKNIGGAGTVTISTFLHRY
jgi:hypothetical protein